MVGGGCCPPPLAITFGGCPGLDDDIGLYEEEELFLETMLVQESLRLTLVGLTQSAYT